MHKHQLTIDPPVVDFGHIQPPVCTHDLQLATSMNVLSLPEGHELRDDESVSRVPHVLPCHTWQSWVSQDVGIAQAYVALRERPVLLSAACRHVTLLITQNDRNKQTESAENRSLTVTFQHCRVSISVRCRW